MLTPERLLVAIAEANARPESMLNVSRPFLIEQLEKNVISHRKVQTHRRVLFQDLMDSIKMLARQRLETSENLAQQAPDLDLGY